jgi:diguanylate cyclase (GGDEF)-like protein/PAS domain S-box-containing protein
VTVDKYRLLLKNSPDLVTHVAGGEVVWVSPSVGAILGGEAHDWIATSVVDLVHPDDQLVLADMGQCLRFGGSALGRMRVRALDGDPRWLDVHAQRFPDAHGQPNGVLASCRPADEMVRAERMLRRMAASDELTGLPNRRELLQWFARGSSADGGVAALFCDVDHFKAVNDTYGHAAGDAVLRMLADRLSSVVRDGDVVARIGGDELLVLLDGVAGLAEAMRLATEIGAVASLPMVIGGTPLEVTLSIGVTMMAPTDGMETLLERADRAMYRAKQFGRNRVVVIPDRAHLAASATR